MTTGVQKRLLHRLALALLVLSALVVLQAAPAAAHDELGDSTPAAGSDVDRAPEEVTLEFGGEPLHLGATIIVADAKGGDWADGDPEVEGSYVRAAVRDGMPDGNYQVRWQIVSGDGAVVSGHFDFAVGDADGAPKLELPEAKVNADTAAETAGGVGSGDFEFRPGANGSTAAATSDSPARTVLIALAGAAAALALVAIYWAIARPRHATLAPNPPAPPEEP